LLPVHSASLLAFFRENTPPSDLLLARFSPQPFLRSRTVSLFLPSLFFFEISYEVRVAFSRPLFS